MAIHKPTLDDAFLSLTGKQNQPSAKEGKVMAVELVFEKKPKWLLSLNDSLLMVRRSSRHIIRNIDQLLGAFFQPIMFLVLFATVFGGAISKALPPGVTYLNFLMAGIIVQTVAFGSTTTAVSVCNDLQKGIVDRFRSLPMSNPGGLERACHLGYFPQCYLDGGDAADRLDYWVPQPCQPAALVVYYGNFVAVHLRLFLAGGDCRRVC